MALRAIAFAIAMAFVSAPGGAPAETIYSWTDEKGVRHLTNVPPVQPGGNMEVFEVKPPQIIGEPEIQYAGPEGQMGSQTETAVFIAGNHVIVPVTLSYRKKRVEARLLLDTGATNITLHRSLARKLSIKSAQKGSIRVAGGELIEAEAVVLDSVNVGPHTKMNLVAGIIKNNAPEVAFDGLLGMNFLKDLHYTVDFENRIIHWR